MIFQAIDCVGNNRGVSITKTSVCVENNCLRFSVIVITKIMLHAHDRGSLFAISIVVAGILPLKTLSGKRCIKKCINMQRCHNVNSDCQEHSEINGFEQFSFV